MRDDSHKAIRRAMMIARQPAAYGGGYGAFPTDPSMMSAQTPVMTEGGPVMETQGQLDASLGSVGYARGGDVEGRLNPRNLPGFHVRVPSSRPSRADGGPVQEPQDDDVRIDNPIIGYHGSPHEFSRFDLSKIGTGEGAQAYGHGSYIAENEGVARDYRDTLSSNFKYYKQKPIGEIIPDDPLQAKIILEMQKMGANADVVNAADRVHYKEQQNWSRLRDARDAVSRDLSKDPSKGHMYEVAIHARPEEFLDWDKPLNEQAPHIQEFAKNVDLSHLKPGNRTRTMLEWYREGKDQPHDPVTGKHLVSALNKTDEHGPETSADLAEAGIPGIRYFDAGNRGAGDGTRNYVVFHPKHMEIKRRYAEGGTVPKMNLNDDATMQKALRVTAKNRPTVALADDFVKQLRGRPRA